MRRHDDISWLFLLKQVKFTQTEQRRDLLCFAFPLHVNTISRHVNPDTASSQGSTRLFKPANGELHNEREEQEQRLSNLFKNKMKNAGKSSEHQDTLHM